MADEPITDAPITSAVWVYDPDVPNSRPYLGYPFEGLVQCEVGGDGQPILPPAKQAALTRAENKADKEASK